VTSKMGIVSGPPFVASLSGKGVTLREFIEIPIA
jgi:hypothetical protein